MYTVVFMQELIYLVSILFFWNSASLLSFCWNMLGRFDGVVRDFFTLLGVNGGCLEADCAEAFF